VKVTITESLIIIVLTIFCDEIIDRLRPEEVLCLESKVVGVCASFVVIFCYLQQKSGLIRDFFKFLNPKNGAKTRKKQGKWGNRAT